MKDEKEKKHKLTLTVSQKTLERFHKEYPSLNISKYVEHCLNAIYFADKDWF